MITMATRHGNKLCQLTVAILKTGICPNNRHINLLGKGSNNRNGVYLVSDYGWMPVPKARNRLVRSTSSKARA
jgi:hypothetical protein